MVAPPDALIEEPETYARQCEGAAVEPREKVPAALTVPAMKRSSVAVGSSWNFNAPLAATLPST
jgi:hypothetical protein